MSLTYEPFSEPVHISEKKLSLYDKAKHPFLIAKAQDAVDHDQDCLRVMEIRILVPNHQRQHRTLHTQKDVLP